jgi:hypothetical protein
MTLHIGLISLGFLHLIFKLKLDPDLPAMALSPVASHSMWQVELLLVAGALNLAALSGARSDRRSYNRLMA